MTASLLLVHSAAVCAIASLAALAPFPAWLVAAGVWLVFAVRLVESHSSRVLIRAAWTNEARLASGSMVLLFPQYVVADRAQFGPWQRRGKLPLVGQILEVDVPEVLVMVEQGLYCLKVNTQVVGCVQDYRVEDLVGSPIAIENRIHSVIATALRKAVHDMTLEKALVEIQRIFSKDVEGISAMIAVPAFKVTQLMLDPNQSICAADAATKQALDIVVQRKQESAKRLILEASMDTEEQKVKLRRITLQSNREEMMLQQEMYGKEGAAMVEAAKHAKAVYLCVGGASAPSSWCHAEK